MKSERGRERRGRGVPRGSEGVGDDGRMCVRIGGRMGESSGDEVEVAEWYLLLPRLFDVCVDGSGREELKDIRRGVKKKR